MIIQNARAKRFEVQGEQDEKETITVSPFWHQELLRVPFVSSKSICVWLPVEKNGRTVFLLKSKAKPQAAERKKRKFELLLPALDV